jgi:hypothetical protein
MKLSEVKHCLQSANAVNFLLPTGEYVPESFHVTEVGFVHKHFIDCGGTIRKETKVNLQLWNSDDLEHRLKAQKLLNIISLSETKLGIEDVEIEVEYQGNTIGKYSLDFNGKDFLLINMQTDCLAKENCGVPAIPGPLAAEQKVCKPGSGCC